MDHSGTSDKFRELCEESAKLKKSGLCTNALNERRGMLMSLWYVMQVRAGAEENVRCQCLRLISSDILEHCFVPYYQQKKRFQGEWHIQETVLFPGYVFLVTSDLKQLMDSLRKVTGMIRLLRTGEQIVPLSGEEVDLLLKLGREEQLVRMSTGVIENVYVKVFDGPLKGMEECIKKIDRYKRKAHIAIEMFGRSMDVEIGLEIISKIK